MRSGFVSVPRMEAIIRRRVFLSTVSVRPALESVDTILRYIGYGGVTSPDDGSLRESLSWKR